MEQISLRFKWQPMANWVEISPWASILIVLLNVFFLPLCMHVCVFLSVCVYVCIAIRDNARRLAFAHINNVYIKMLLLLIRRIHSLCENGFVRLSLPLLLFIIRKIYIYNYFNLRLVKPFAHNDTRMLIAPSCHRLRLLREAHSLWWLNYELCINHNENVMIIFSDHRCCIFPWHM